MLKKVPNSVKEFIQKNKTILGALAVAVIISGAATAGTLAAYHENDDDHYEGRSHVECEYKRGNGERGEFRIQHREIRDAVDEGDYDTWADLMEDTEHFDEENITPEMFDALQEVHELMENGDKEEARALMEELGLHPMGKKFKESRGEHKGELKEIFDERDYDAWVDLMTDSERFENIELDHDTFDMLLEAHELRQEGDHQAAKEIMQDIFGEDFQPHNKHKRFKHRVGALQ